MEKIPGGFYIKARRIQESEIAHRPPHYREIWDWLLRMANHKDQKIYGKTIRRGELHCTIDDIREGLHWFVGWRKERYSYDDCENAMRWLKKAKMVTAKRTGRGAIVTICNYDHYQNPQNYGYGTDNGACNGTSTEHVRSEKQECKKERKNIKRRRNTKEFVCDAPAYVLAKFMWDEMKRRGCEDKEPDLQKWAVHIDYMLRLDKRDPRRVAEVIRWSQKSGFWKRNVRCTEKLRKQWAKLVDDMKAEQEKEQGVQQAAYKTCPHCKARIPQAARYCPVCERKI